MPHLSESMEDYLEAIAELIAVEGHAHTKEIADKLNVKMPSVTGALRQLEQMGYIIYNTHYPVQLTRAGREIAERIVYRHSVLKQFFSRILGLPLQKADDTACRLEHAVDDDTISRFILFSEAIGTRRDAGEIQIYLTEAMHFLGDNDSDRICVLSRLPLDTPASVKLIGRNIRGEDCPAEGSGVVLKSISLDHTVFTVESDGKIIDLPARVAENLWVKRTERNSHE